MNCKPGDLAVVVNNSPQAKEPLCGKFVDVLYAAPSGVYFRLPDGVLSDFVGTDRWVVKWQSPVSYPMYDGPRLYYAPRMYGVLPDYALRPIRPQPDDAVDEMVVLCPVDGVAA